jgi:hypothetical protein
VCRCRTAEPSSALQLASAAAARHLGR